VKKKLLVLAGILAIGALTYAPFRIGISPTEFKFNMMESLTQTGAFVVMNGGRTELEVDVYANDVYMDEDGNTRYVEPDEKIPYSLARWIKIVPERFSLKPGAYKQVKFTMKVPPFLQGTRLAIIFADTHDINQPKGTMMFRGRVGTWVEALMEGVEAESPLGDISALQVGYLSRLKQLISSVSFVNQSGLVIRLTGSIEIFNASGEIVFSGNFGQAKRKKKKEYKVFPFKSRTIKDRFDVNLPEGRYKALVKLDYGAEELLGAETSFSISSKAEVKNLKIEKSYVGKPVEFTFKIFNKGTTVLKPQCTMLIRKYDGEIVSTEQQIKTPEIMPGEHKNIYGFVTANLEVEKYTAYLNMLYGEHHVVERLEKTFFTEFDKPAPSKGGLRKRPEKQVEKEPDEWDEQ